MTHRAVRWPAATAVVASLIALLVAAPPAAACSCMGGIEPAEMLTQADAAFTGRVVAFEEVKRETDYGTLYRMRTVVEVDAVWKGLEDDAPAALDEVVVWTGTGGGDCGYPFSKGDRYLIYAFEHDGELSTGICSRTRPVSMAEADFEALGEARVEVPRETEGGGM